MSVKRKEVLLSIAMFCLVAALVLKRLGGGIPHVAFIEGLLLGVSVTLNIAYLLRRPKKGDTQRQKECEAKRGGDS
jgi:hypothetical protein